MSNLPNAAERRQNRITALHEELKVVILKVNYHFHSGYEHNDLRKPESIFMNFLKKQPSVIHSSIMMRLKNRDFRLSMDEDRFVSKIYFTDLAYDSYRQLTDFIQELNEACVGLDYAELRINTNMLDKYLQIADRDIQFLKEFKIG